MNKIVVDVAKKEIENFVGRLEVKKDLHLICSGSNKVEIELINDISLEVVLMDDCDLELVVIDEIDFSKRNVRIVQNNRSKIVYVESFASRSNKFIEIKNIVKGNNNDSKIRLRTVAYQDEVKINVTVEAYEKTMDNTLIEDIKGIVYGGNIKISPDMMIRSNEVMANHFVSIGPVDKDVLFYLEEKGLSDASAIELLIEGFLK